MSAPKGIRLWLRPAREGHAATWIIRDGSRQISTGCFGAEIEAANEALGEYIKRQYKPERASDKDPSQIPVADILLLYLDEKVGPEPDKSDPQDEKIRGRARKLSAFFGGTVLSDINKAKCKEYVAERMREQTAAENERVKKSGKTPRKITAAAARRELEDLRAAINHFFSDDLIPPKVNIWLPDKSDPRERWLTESEAAKWLWTAWRKTQAMPKGGRRYVSRHIAKFALVGLYTGTRAAAICGAAIRPTVGRGYVDLERGVFYRRPPGTKESSKRQPSVKLPDKLLAHIRRWARLGLCENCVVEWEGEPVKRVSKGFRAVSVAAGLHDVTPHTLRHTAISWALQRGTKRFDVADYFGVSEKVIERTYGHHDPEHHAEVTMRMDRRHKSKTAPVAQPVAETKTRLKKTAE